MSATPNRLSILIQEPNAQGLERPDATVNGGASADAQNDALSSAIQGRTDQLTGSITGGDHRVSFMSGN